MINASPNASLASSGQAWLMGSDTGGTMTFAPPESQKKH